MNQPSMIKSALIGGVVAGVVSSIPIVGMLNACCCALLIGGGLLSAFLYSKESKAAGVGFRAGGGATIGLLAAPFYSITTAIMGALMKAVGLAPDLSEILMQMEENGMQPEQLEMVEKVFGMIGGDGNFLIALVGGLIFNLILGAIFCTIGGLIGGAVFKSEPQEQETIDV